MPRPVEPAPKYRDDVLEDFKHPSTKCVTGADFLLEELEDHDPDLEERCGLDLSRFCAAPSARLSQLSFEGDGAFPSQC